ncbi:MAG TPA: cupredoxin domain-containing protein [Gaiellaceae bacterium]|nr:cupredoxin domain-containing protein [Gaiellaceae bacterium]
MRTLAALAALAVLLPAQASARTFPTRIQVTAKEFYYTLSSRTVKSGPAVIQFVNYGEDPHDMRVQRVGDAKVYRTPIMQPGGIVNLSVRLAPGKYQLWCSIANHRQLGMQAVLIVKAK